VKSTLFSSQASSSIGVASSTQTLFQNEILKDEKILWSGQPKQGFFLTGGDILASLIGLIFFLGIGSFMEYTAIQSFDIYHMIFSLPFILIGLYLVFGSIIYNNYQKKRTYYAVTNQRVLVLINSFNKKIESKLISQISVLNKTVTKDGSGTIKFDNTGYKDTGENSYRIKVLSFDNIIDVDIVYRMISELRSPHEISYSMS
jgi:hypothetical protein